MEDESVGPPSLSQQPHDQVVTVLAHEGLPGRHTSFSMDAHGLLPVKDKTPSGDFGTRVLCLLASLGENMGPELLQSLCHEEGGAGSGGGPTSQLAWHPPPSLQMLPAREKPLPWKLAQAGSP